VRRKLINFSLVLGSTLFFLVIFEIALRVIGYNPFAELLDGRGLFLRESENQLIEYELVPNSEGYAWGAEVKVNRHGFRDRNYNIKKPAGTYRVLVIGDSVTFGIKLPIEGTFPEILEQSFRHHNIAAEVLNFSVAGYDTIQEVALFQERGLQFDPDEVLVGYCMNDLGKVSLELQYIRRMSSYGNAIYHLRTAQFVRNQIDKLIAKLSTGSRRENYHGDPGEIESPEIVGDPYVSERIRQIEEYVSSGADYHHALPWYASELRLGKLRQAFEQLNELSRQHDFKVSVVIIPFVLEHVDAHDAAYDLVRHEARRTGFDVIELRQEFVDVGIEKLMISPTDSIHPNELGHQLIAKRLFAFYTQESIRQFSLIGTAD
jgi:lysophospholipase L1-like esterase